MLMRKTERQNSVYFEHFGGRALIDGDWKIVSFTRKPFELHNIKSDLTEMKDLVDSNPEKLRQMSDMYQNWSDSIGVIPVDELASHKLEPWKKDKDN